MNLSHSQQRMLAEMPSLTFGQDEPSYCRAVMSWAREVGYPTIEALQLAKARWKSWEIERLILEIEDGSQDALKRAVIMLLKDRYIV